MLKYIQKLQTDIWWKYMWPKISIVQDWMEKHSIDDGPARGLWEEPLEM